MKKHIITSALYCRLFATVILSFLVFDDAFAQDADLPAVCGSLKNAYGPFDYTNPRDVAAKLPRVEKAHFDLGVRELKGHRAKPFSWQNLAADLDYTLRAFPNHHEALYVMAQYYLLGFNENHSLRYSASCYFNRAKINSPKDGNVYLVEGIYFARLGKLKDAENSYLKAIRMMPNSSEAHYNIGLLYLNQKDYPAAREQAKLAYDRGYPMPGLRNQLQELGQWEE